MAEPLPPPPPATVPSPPPTSRGDQVVAAVGVALLAAALTLSTVYSRKDGGLDWTNYLVGLAATVALLAVAAAGRIRRRPGSGPDDRIGWPGAAGILGAGSMIGVALDDSGASAYVVGLAVLGLSIVAYYLVDQHGGFVLSAIGGFALVYANIVDDLFDAAELEGDNTGMVISLALLVFTALVTGATWFLPERVLGGVVAGAVAVAGHFLLLAGLAIGIFFQATFVSFSEGGSAPSRLDTFDNDVWVVLLVALLLAAGWAWLGLRTGHVGFRILIVAISVTVVPMATVVLAVEHPSWWGATVGVLGAATLGALLLRRTRPPAPPAAPPYSG